jgi:hypothetical protein
LTHTKAVPPPSALFALADHHCQVKMPLTYVIDASRRIIVVRASGILTESEMRSTRILVQADPAFNSNFGQLFDLRGATDIVVSVPAMARLAATSSFSPGVRRAFVGVTDVQYNVAWTFARLSEPHDQLIHVFRDISVAEAWLMEGTYVRTREGREPSRATRSSPRSDRDERISRM